MEETKAIEKEHGHEHSISVFGFIKFIFAIGFILGVTVSLVIMAFVNAIRN